MSEPYDRVAWRHEEEPRDPPEPDVDPLELARENVFDGWPSSEDVSGAVGDSPAEPSEPTFAALPEADGSLAVEAPPAEAEQIPEGGPGEEDELAGVALVDPAPTVQTGEHAPGELDVPPGYSVLEGAPNGSRRAVGVVVSRFNGDVTSRLLESALGELDAAGVSRDAITVMPVPGAFELPIGAMALAKTRRFACIVALGCIIRGDTPHFDYVAGETASGLQLAALETGVPVAFGVLTLERADQAEPRLEKGAEAVRTALEMADLFSHLRAAAAR